MFLFFIGFHEYISDFGRKRFGILDPRDFSLKYVQGALEVTFFNKSHGNSGQNWPNFTRVHYIYHMSLIATTFGPLSNITGSNITGPEQIFY